MPLTKLNFKPGINKEETDYANEGGWVDGDKIRFRKGRVEKNRWLAKIFNFFNNRFRKSFALLDFFRRS